MAGIQYATNPLDGKKLLKEMKKASSLDDLVVSFENIEMLSSAFLNSSIGKFTLSHPYEIEKVKFIFPENDFIMRAKLEDIIENALLGEDYDHLVKSASLS